MPVISTRWKERGLSTATSTLAGKTIFQLPELADILLITVGVRLAEILAWIEENNLAAVEVKLERD